MFQTFPEIAQFLAGLPRTELVREIALGSGLPLAEVERRLDDYLNEVHAGFAVVRPHLAKESLILEVGSGLGLLSAFLAHSGYRIVNLEPAGRGFYFLPVARKAIQRFAPAPVARLDIGAEELDPQSHGMFDLIFSINVLEHVCDLTAAISGMASVLSKDGHMAFPYEPHTGLPLLPFVPGLTRVFLPSRIVRSDIWQSLNFLTAGEVRRIAHRCGLEAKFYPGLLADSLDRTLHDRVFAARHSSLAVRIARRSTAVLRHLPAGFASPMLFELRHCTAELRPKPRGM